MIRVLVAVALCYWSLSSLAAGKLVNRHCIARWLVLGCYGNSRPYAHQKQFFYHSGLRHLQPDTRPYWDQLQYVEVTTQYGSKFRSTSSELESYQRSSGWAHVQANLTVCLWQLNVRMDSKSLKFRSFETLSRVDAPPSVTSCQAVYEVRQPITRSTWVRLKHSYSQMYLTLTSRKGWDAGTLGYSTSYRFRFEEYYSGVYRIYSESYRFSGYTYVYSAMGGGIYLDESDPSDKQQLWRISTSDLRDGDSITIENVYYYGGYMIQYSGSTTNVFCEYTSSPDRWIVELA